MEIICKCRYLDLKERWVMTNSSFFLFLCSALKTKEKGNALQLRRWVWDCSESPDVSKFVSVPRMLLLYHLLETFHTNQPFSSVPFDEISIVYLFSQKVRVNLTIICECARMFVLEQITGQYSCVITMCPC